MAVSCRATWLGTALLLVGSRAHAGPPPPRGLEIGARVAFETNSQGMGMLAGMQIGGRVVPHLSLGAYGDVSPLHSPFVPKCGGCEPDPKRPLRFGAFGDIHLIPRGTVDPWFRLAFGMVSTRTTSADAEIDFGLDIRGRRIAVGPFAAWIIPFGDQQPKNWLGVGVRAVVSF
ncbi:MAG: hypothetical protein ACXVEF_03780 [Polyangiales bacterium]